MKRSFSTREAAEKLGVTLKTLQRHVSAGTIPAPAIVKVGGVSVRLWTKRDIEKARKILAATKPGRKPKKA
jgi:excisionase family DNA binding protein